MIGSATLHQSFIGTCAARTVTGLFILVTKFFINEANVISTSNVFAYLSDILTGGGPSYLVSDTKA